MKITSAEFIKSGYKPDHWPEDGRIEIAFLGRSNVGKSSLLNSLLQRKGLARTSNTPGRTQAVNFFLVNDGFYFVDLPGYGYARVSKSIRASWGEMAESYLRDREELALSIQLIDSRHKPTDLDLQLNEWLIHHEKPHIVVATKADKLSSNQLRNQLKLVENALPKSKVVPYSSQTGKGREALLSVIEAALKKY